MEWLECLGSALRVSVLPTTTTATASSTNIMDKSPLSQTGYYARRPASQKPRMVLAVIIASTLFYLLPSLAYWPPWPQPAPRVPKNADAILAQCRALNTKPGPPADFNKRTASDRFQPGTKAVWIKNATLWTGRVDGFEIIYGDLLLEDGLIKGLGKIGSRLLHDYDEDELVQVNAEGAWVTPGLVDVHSHIGIWSAPVLEGANDSNSLKGLAQPWLRSVDAINTHDESYTLSRAGGVTTSLILPGSANGIGGQAFLIKLRSTEERSTYSLLLEPPFGLNGSEVDLSIPPRWRHMKHACGENPSAVYGVTRMDTVWSQRQAYDKARSIKQAQDEYCHKALSGKWDGLGAFPDELQWEALVDILRGRVKVQTHCYEAVDMDAFVRLSNEFQFPVAAFHHAHEAYLIPEALRNAYEHPPAIAMFAAFARYKREAYRHSEYAPRVLDDEGIPVIMKSDHQGIVSRYLLHEAQQAHYYGLKWNVALRSVISTPAEVLGLDHRVGFLQQGYDADVVIWDSHPLSLGATPKQVYIDGIPQLESPHVISKPESAQVKPSVPNFDEETEQTLKYEGLPPLEARNTTADRVVFFNISHIYVKSARGKPYGIEELAFPGGSGIFAISNGKRTCMGDPLTCGEFMSDTEAKFVNLQGGSISPGLVSYGSLIGLGEISGEMSTMDGVALDPLVNNIPSLLSDTVINAVDGLQFGSRDALLAHRAGVTYGITPPFSPGFLSGISTAFSYGAAHRLEDGALVKKKTAFHVHVRHGTGTSISTQVGALRHILLGSVDGELAAWSKDITEGTIPLVVTAHSADIIATLIALKQEVEDVTSTSLKLTIVGATEAHLLAAELAAANIGVLLNPPRQFPYQWEYKRILAGPPLSEESAATVLKRHGVTVAIGPQGTINQDLLSGWAVRNLRFDAGWLSLESGGSISHTDALAMASTNVELLFGLDTDPETTDYIATRGGDLLSFESKVIAIISNRRGVVELF